MLSFSLSSVIDESIRLEQFHRRRKDHVKVVSDLSHTGRLKHEYPSNSDVKPKKETLSNFKKIKKDKLEGIESKESKAISGNPLSQLLNLKSPVATDKKSFKSLATGSSTKRRKIEEK